MPYYAKPSPALPFANVKSDYGAAGDGVIDDRTAIQNAITALNAVGGGIAFIPGGTYLLGSPIQMLAGVWLIGEGTDRTTLRLKAGTFANFTFSYLVQSASAQNRVRVADMTLDGNLRSGGASTNQGGLLSPWGSYWTIERIRFYDTNYFKLMLGAGAVHTRVRDSIWEATGGVNDNIGGGGCVDAVVEGCYFASTISGNVIDITTGTRLVFRNNHSDSSAAVYFEGLTESELVDNYFKGSIVLQDNAGYNPSALVQCRGCTVANNTIENAVNGVIVTYRDYAGAASRAPGGGNLISGNSIITPAKAGIIVQGYPGTTYKNEGDIIVNNRVLNPNTDSSNSQNTGLGLYENAGITLGVGVGDVIAGNVVTETRGTPKMRYGFTLTGASTSAVVDSPIVEGNTSRGHTTAGIIVSTPANLVSERVGANIGFSLGVQTVASAATITPSHSAKIVNVTGTTTITSVTATWPGHPITIVFAGILTFTDGSNLRLAGNFVSTADDSISLVCDGTNWYEVSRSIN